MEDVSVVANRRLSGRYRARWTSIVATLVVATAMTLVPSTFPRAEALPAGPSSSTTVAPNGDGTTTNWSKGGTCTAGSYYTCVNDYADSSGGSYIETTSDRQSSVNFTLDLANMPSDFRSATAITVESYAMHNNAGASGGVDTQKLGIDIISNSVKIATSPADQTLTTSYANYSFSLVPNAWNDKTTWDGAQIRAYGKWTVNGTNDTTSKVRVASARVSITYLTTTGYLTQQRYIFENDDGGGSADGNTQMAANNTAITSVKKGERINARFQVSNATNPMTSDIGLFYDRNDGYWSRVMATAPIPSVIGSNCDTDTKWVCGTVDTSPDDWGMEHGIAIDHNGRPWISYFDSGTNGNLKVATYVGANGNCGTSSSWNCVTVYANSEAGRRSSIVIDHENVVWVAFYVNTATPEVVVANNRPGGGGCAAGGSSDWSCTTVATGAILTSDEVSIPIAIGPSGKPAIAYNVNTGSYMQFAQYVGSGGDCTASSGTWDGCSSSVRIDTDGFVDLAFAPDGKPWVAYHNSSTDRLYVARWRGVSGGGSTCDNVNWDCMLVDNNGVSGKYAQIAFGSDGTAWVAYQAANDDLKLAHYVGSGGGSAQGCGSSSSAEWACVFADVANSSAGGYLGMAIAPDGYPWIVHYDSLNDLRLARYVGAGGGGSGAGCGTGSDSHMFCGRIHATGDMGNFPVIAFAPDGTAWIAHGDDTAKDLAFARLNRGGEILMTPSLGAVNGASISESHGDMTSTTDTSNRDDADCVSGTWTNGKAFQRDRGSGVSLTSGQCTEIAFTIDTSQATAGTTYRLMVASADGYSQSSNMWRGPASVSAFGSLAIEASTTTRHSKDALPSSATNCTSSSWACTSIATTDTVGAQSSIAFTPDGQAWLAYNDTTNGALKVAKYVGEGGGGSTCAGGSNAWNCSTIEQSSGHAYGNESVSLAIDGSGTPWISYYDGGSSYKDLYVAKYVGSGGSGCTGAAAAQWTCMQVTTTNNSGQHNSIVIDASGRPWVAYYEGNGTGVGKLMVAHYGSETNVNGTGCSGTGAAKWTCSSITTANDQGKQNAIAIDGYHNPWIVYKNSTSDVVAVARYVGNSGTGCGTNVSTWSCSTLDTTNGFSPSIAFDGTTSAWISYYTSGSILKIAKYVSTGGTGCTGTTAWSCGQIDTSTPNTSGYYTSIAIDSVGRPWISYENTSGDRKVARYVASNGSCGTGNFLNMFTCTDVSPTSGTFGEGTSIAFDGSGTPWVSSSRTDTGDLVVAKLKAPAGQPGYLVRSVPFSGRNAQNGDLRYTLDFGKAPRSEAAGTCSSNTDAKGYCAIGTNDAIYDAMSAVAYESPTYVFATRTASNASFPSYSWRGQSNVASSTSNITLEVYRFGTTNSWTTLATGSTAAANTLFTLTGTASAGSASEYWEADGSNYWTYFRVVQAAGSSATTLKTTYFGAPISHHVQSPTPATANGSGASSSSLAFGSNNTAGNTVVAAFAWYAEADLVGCSDTRGNTYTIATVQHYPAASDWSLGICYATNIAAGANTVTATLNDSATYRRLSIHEYTGFATVSPLDVLSTNAAAGTTASNNITSGSATTTLNGDLIFGVTVATNTTMTVGTNYTQRAYVDGSASTGMMVQDRVLSTAGSVASTMTFGTARNYLAQMIALKPDSATPPTGPALVQRPTPIAQSTSSTTMNLAFGSNNTAGNLIVVATAWYENATTFTCSDTQGNSYTTRTATGPANFGWSMGICYAANIAAGANTVTVTYNASTDYRRMSIHEYSGVATSNVVDVSATNSSSSSGTSADGSTSTTATTAANGDLIFGAAAIYPGSPISAGTGFTKRTAAWSGMYDVGLVTQDRVQTSAGSVASTMTHGISSGYLHHMVAFKQPSLNQAPAAPSSIEQYKSNGTTVIANDGWTNETTVVFKATVTDADNDNVQLCVEIDPLATSFAGTENTCGSAVASGSTASVTVSSGLAHNTQYHWQVRAKDANSEYSSTWTQYDSGNLAFAIDTGAPSTTTIYDGTSEDVDAAFNDGSLTSLSANWDDFADAVSGINRYEYTIGTTVGGSDIKTATSVNTSTSFTATSLTLHTGQLYYVRVSAYDNAGNSTTADTNGQLVAPLITFNLSGSSVTFADLNPTNSYTDSKTLTATVATNAYNGYDVTQYATGLLSYGSSTIPMFAGTWANPTTWSGSGFGYTSSDTSVVGVNRFVGGTEYAGVKNGAPGDVIADSSMSAVSGDQYTLSYRITAPAGLAAGRYSGTLVISAVASF